MTTAEAEDEPAFEFEPEFQEKIAALMARDTTFAMRANDLVKPSYFADEATGVLVGILQDHLKVHRQVPDLKLMTTILKDEIQAKRMRQDLVPDVIALVKRIQTADLSGSAYVAQKVSEFAKHQAMEQAIMASVPLLEKGKFDEIEKVVRQAQAVGANDEGGLYDFWAEAEARSQKRADILAGKIKKEGITTGHAGLDALLYHGGWGRRELSCLMGAAKAGKSMGLGEFAKNASLAGFNVLYASCEVSKEIIAERTEASVTNTLMRMMQKDHATVLAEMQRIRATAGRFFLRDYASGTLKPSQLNRQIERCRSEGVILDLVVPDYADIMAAEYRSDNLIDNLRAIYIDLRAIAHENNLAMLTATQTNRTGAKAVTAQATDVGDDWNKARTVDILIGINATDAEKGAGKARLAWLLSRNTEDGFSIEIEQDRSRMQFLKRIIGRI